MHVVFDLDGVLLDSGSDMDWYHRALDATLGDLGVEPTEELLELLSLPSIERFREAADRLDVPLERLWAIRDREYVREKNAAMRRGEIGPFEDVSVVLDLAERYPLSIISNSPQSVVEVFLDASGLANAFETVVGRGRDLRAIELTKPNPHSFDRLDAVVAADRYVYVGDAETDREFADRTGMAFIHLDRTDGSVDSLHAVKRRLDELGGTTNLTE